MTDSVLVTGAAGMIAPDLAARLAGRYRLVMSDRRPADTPFEFLEVELTDSASVGAALSGIDAVVHLGAVTWDRNVRQEMIPSNVEGVYTVFEEARKAGVSRIVFASSHHTLGYHHADGSLEVPETAEPRPDTFYAVTKLYGEALGRWFSERYGMYVYCLRIGYYMTPERIAEGFGRYKEALVLSPRDFAQMVDLCLQAREPRYGVYNCISSARRPWVSIEKARSELGYEPEDSVETLFGSVPPAGDLGAEDFAWLYGETAYGPEH